MPHAKPFCTHSITIMHLNGIWLLFSIWNGTKTLNAFHFQQHRKRNEPCLFIAGLLCFSHIFHCHFAIINRKIYYVPSDNCAHVKRHMHNEIEKEPLFLLFFCRLFFFAIQSNDFHFTRAPDYIGFLGLCERARSPENNELALSITYCEYDFHSFIACALLIPQLVVCRQWIFLL